MKKYEELLREKYNPDNIFKNSKENIIENLKENEIVGKQLLNIENLTISKKIFIKFKEFLHYIIKKFRK